MPAGWATSFPLLPRGWRRITGVGVYFDRVNYREPDLVVFRSSALANGRLTAADVVLAVEVVSPSSRANDRIAKPAQYAAAGIPYYWRLEQDPLELVTYTLDGDSYRETGRFSDEVVVHEPVAARFRLGDLREM